MSSNGFLNRRANLKAVFEEFWGIPDPFTYSNKHSKTPHSEQKNPGSHVFLTQVQKNASYPKVNVGKRAASKMRMKVELPYWYRDLRRCER